MIYDGTACFVGPQSRKRLQFDLWQEALDSMMHGWLLYVGFVTRSNKVITTMVIRPLDDRTYCIVLDLQSLNWSFGG